MLSTECFTSVVFPNTTQRSRGQYVRWPSATWKTSDTMQGPFTTHIRKSNGWLEREIHSLWVKNELGLEAAPFAPDSSNCTVRKAPAAPRSSAGNTRERRYAITAPPQEVPDPRLQRCSPAPLSRPPPVRCPPPWERRKQRHSSRPHLGEGARAHLASPALMDGRTAPGGGAAAPGADPRRMRSREAAKPLLSRKGGRPSAGGAVGSRGGADLPPVAPPWRPVPFAGASPARWAARLSRTARRPCSASWLQGAGFFWRLRYANAFCAFIPNVALWSFGFAAGELNKVHLCGSCL